MISLLLHGLASPECALPPRSRSLQKSLSRFPAVHPACPALTHALWAVHSHALSPWLAACSQAAPAIALEQEPVPSPLSGVHAPCELWLHPAGWLHPHADIDLSGTPGLLMATSFRVFSRLIFARLYCHSRLTARQSVNSRVGFTNAVWHRNAELSEFLVWKMVSHMMWHWRASTATGTQGGCWAGPGNLMWAFGKGRSLTGGH